MPDAAGLSLHFLRPWWLAALLPAAAMLILILHRARIAQRWGDVIAPHLLRHLVVRPQGSWRLPPAWLVAAALVLGIVALAGPSWRRELPPFVEDKAPLMIVLDVSASMAQQDVAPSRLERAKQKIHDLLASRGTARTGLVAYAGTAHLVMPLTDDRAVTEPFLAALAPGLMPVEGRNAAAALSLAAAQLATEPLPGTILLVADDTSGLDAAAAATAVGRNALLVLQVGSRAASGRAAPGLRAQTVAVSVDDTDIQVLQQRIASRFEAAQAVESGARWRDEGHWLLIPLALLGLAWFRRGTTVQWAVLFLLLEAMPARAQDHGRFVGLWLTADQQGRIAFERGDYHRAATLFADPMWRGIAAYRAYDYLAAAEAFAKVDSAAGRFALGNAQAHNHAWEKAIAAYQAVLAEQPGHQAARANLAIVRAAFEAAEAKRREREQGQAPPDLRADAMKVDPKQAGGKRIQVQPTDVTTPGAADAWMRETETTPAEFLKLKFAIQAASPLSPSPSSR